MTAGALAPSALGGILGLIAGLGLLLAVSRVPALRRPRFEDRVAPYLRDSPRPSRLLTAARSVTPLPTLERILAPVLADGVRVLERLLGGGTSVRRRLERAGRGQTLEEFRVEQLVWGSAALLGALALSLLLLARGSVQSPLALLLLCCVACVGGVLARDHRLTSEVARREERMMAEFPTIAELLALAVTAGESALGALERISRISQGELSRELARVLAEIRSGTSLVQALQGMADRTSLPALARFVDGITVAVERGTPLSDVLRAQAVDAREAGKRALLEAGGRKEIAMMVPVVFLVLPVTVVFALFPGFLGFSLTV